MSRRDLRILALFLALFLASLALWTLFSVTYWRDGIIMAGGTVNLGMDFYVLPPLLLAISFLALAYKDGGMNGWVAFSRTLRLTRLAAYSYAGWWGANYLSNTWNADVGTAGSLLLWLLPLVGEIGLAFITGYLLGKLAAWSDTKPTQVVIDYILFRR